jgi:hypothetical protein
VIGADYPNLISHDFVDLHGLSSIIQS